MAAPPPGPIEITALLPWHSWWADFLAAPSAALTLDLFITHGAVILQRVGPLVTAVHGATGTPEAAEVVRICEERRVDSYREAVDVIAARPGGLRPDMPATAKATDVVVVLFSAEVYQVLAARGWAHSACLAFFRETLTAKLLAPKAQGPPARPYRPPAARSVRRSGPVGERLPLTDDSSSTDRHPIDSVVEGVVGADGFEPPTARV